MTITVCVVVASTQPGVALATDAAPVETIDQLQRSDGTRVAISGTYEEIDVREKQSTPPVHAGHVAIRLTDGNFVYLGHPWGTADVRSSAERASLSGMFVQTAGVFHSRCPETDNKQAAHIVGPCLDPVASVGEMIRERTESFPEDKVLSKLKSSLPPGWKLIRKDSQLGIEGDKPLWEVFYNRINAPPDWEDDANAQWETEKKKHGPVHARFAFSFESRWSAQKIRDAKIANRKTLDRAESERPKRANSAPSKEGWEEASNFDAKVKDKLIKLPYETERYSLFLLERHGIEDEFTVVFPRDAGEDAQAAWNAVRSALKDESE